MATDRRPGRMPVWIMRSGLRSRSTVSADEICACSCSR